MPDWLKLYHRSPYPIRVLAATGRGYYLRSWRYGAETEMLIEEARERENWSRLQWKTWQEERLAYVLHRAATRVPYYRDQWRQRRRAGDRASWEVLENWPLLRKDALRARPRAFVADDCDLRSMYTEHTSGTTGTPLILWWSRETVRHWYALFEARARGWYGVSRYDRWAILGGQLVAPASQTRPPYWVWNAGLRQLYLSTYHLAPDTVASYIEAMRRHEVRYLLGYASAMESLARMAQEQGLEPPRLVVAISNAEPLYERQRSVVSEVFGCPVRDTYGMAEIASMATECEAGSMHLWPDVGVTEVWDENGSPAARCAEAGRLILTGLLNQDMPLVRYEVGDRGAVSREHDCTCGRYMPLLRSMEGRIDDMLITRDGRRIGRLDPVFKADLPLREAQVIQESLDRIRVRFVPAEAYQRRHDMIIVDRVRERMGDVDVFLEPVERIARSRNGKLKAVISRVGETSKAALDGSSDLPHPPEE